ncbi:MAG: YaeQ family protein [Polyangiaceae bacterium]|nr:YaeQ family protein [Polyangiaceae bacterium]
MALTATMYHIQVDLSDVDRGVYESLDLRVARHPSESMRYLLTRTLAYCLAYEEGIAFSKGGLSNTDDPPLSIHDLQGNLRTWIEIGTPSAERLHKASKASPRLVVFTQHDPMLLQKTATERDIHRAQEIEIYALEPTFLDELDAVTDRNVRWELVHTDGQLYVTVGGKSIVGSVARHKLVQA